ncbi:MAG: hypothetical protein GYB64_06040 [Chloroflexi bacterium]|nr:hypothetical protein [Chloroflexota bacterium]
MLKRMFIHKPVIECVGSPNLRKHIICPVCRQMHDVMFDVSIIDLSDAQWEPVAHGVHDRDVTLRCPSEGKAFHVTLRARSPYFIQNVNHVDIA